MRKLTILSLLTCFALLCVPTFADAQCYNNGYSSYSSSCSSTYYPPRQYYSTTYYPSYTPTYYAPTYFQPYTYAQPSCAKSSMNSVDDLIKQVLLLKLLKDDGNSALGLSLGNGLGVNLGGGLSLGDGALGLAERQRTIIKREVVEAQPALTADEIAKLKAILNQAK